MSEQIPTHPMSRFGGRSAKTRQSDDLQFHFVTSFRDSIIVTTAVGGLLHTGGNILMVIGPKTALILLPVFPVLETVKDLPTSFHMMNYKCTLKTPIRSIDLLNRVHEK